MTRGSPTICPRKRIYIWMLRCLNKGQSKRELREELENFKRVREQNRYLDDVRLLKNRIEELQKQVEFYKAESGYYKGQAEKNLELLGKALENGPSPSRQSRATSPGVRGLTGEGGK